MSHEENMMQELDSSNDEWGKELEGENEESKFTGRRLVKKSISVPELVDEVEEDLDDFTEPADDFNDKVGKKRQRKKKDESGLEKTKKNKKQNSEEVQEMWDSITNDTNSQYGDKVVVKPPKKKDEDAEEIKKLFSLRKKKSKCDKTSMEIGIEGKPAINKLMKLPLLNETLSKKPLQGEFLDHGVLNLLKNWLEPLPDGSLPNINIRSAVLMILNDFRIDLDQDSRREQLIKSGLGKVIMFLSKSDEETTPNRRLANDIINKWGRIIYNKSTRYDNMFTQEEIDEQRKILLRRQTKTAPKVSGTRARDFNTDIDLYELGTWTGRARAKIPTTMSMDFKIRPPSKVDINQEEEPCSKWQMEKRHKNLTKKQKQQKNIRKGGMQALKLSVDGCTMLKYL
ncbi:Transcription factor IIS N-terminal [Arabidopsis thaliana x Arabidopsis arenosa]|uniref:Transcription factor IIS N-terminal n=1 Tax=Arabidopsis thaliana x Arabidopsis arenosa TaxID=1240361 RepID=A0A8T2DXV0_9BRAS|nr:Transcription factor IIS N-terminal [Arabidopsis thaliana x Arabidopsis arenosa]